MSFLWIFQNFQEGMCRRDDDASSQPLDLAKEELAVAPPSSLTSEAVNALRIAIPMASANLVERGSFWVTWALVGRLGADFLGPVSLASSVVNVFGVSITIGLSMAVSTLASQAKGARDTAALGLVLQRALAVNCVFCAPVVMLLLVLEPVLRRCGMEPEFAARAGAYGVTLLPAAVLTGSLRALQTWLSSQSVTRPQLVVSCVMLPVHALLCYVLTYHTRLGYLGAGVSMSLSVALRATALYIYVRCNCKEAFPGLTFNALTGWWGYLALALPGVAMLSEYWVGETLMLVAAKLPHAAATLSALAIYQLGNTTMYQPPGGLRIAANTCVGTALGAARPEAARTAVQACFMLVCVWLPVPATGFLGFTQQWAHVFTQDVEVVSQLVALAPWLVAYVSLDAVLAVSNGALSGSGQQAIGGRLALISYVAISLPTALALGFGTGAAGVGLMSGHVVGKAVHSAGSFLLVMQTRWDRQSERAIQRVATLHDSCRERMNSSTSAADSPEVMHPITPVAEEGGAGDGSSRAALRPDGAHSAVLHGQCLQRYANGSEGGCRIPMTNQRTLRTGTRKGAMRLQDDNDSDDGL
jgi:MATE family multidrug resistance protein